MPHVKVNSPALSGVNSIAVVLNAGKGRAIGEFEQKVAKLGA